jgi:adenine-specific DNA-methyltransferase
MGGQGESRAARPNLFYPLTAPDGTEVLPKMKDGQDGAWRWSREKAAQESKRIEWKRTDQAWTPYIRIYADTSAGIPPETIFYNTEVGSSRSAKTELKAIFRGEQVFETPKPVELIERVLSIGSTTDSIILDSFAGSGSTAHAVLKANIKDSGTRQFILVETEKYADQLTAERVRRVINGYAFEGTHREELLVEKLTWTKIQKMDELLEKARAIRSREGFGVGEDLTDSATAERRFERVNTRVENGILIVEGEKRVAEQVPGLGGEFTFCTLGEPIDQEAILSGRALPDYQSLGAWLYYTATGGTLERRTISETDCYLGEAQNRHLWLIYKPDLTFLKSTEAALTLSFAHRVRERDRKKGHLVFAAAKFMSNRQLLEYGVEYAPLPFALYREG